MPSSSSTLPSRKSKMIKLGSDPFPTNSSKLPNEKLPILKSPGPDSNYMDWEFVVTSYFEAAGPEYILEKYFPENPSAAWINNKKLVCAMITQLVDSTNLRFLCKHQRNAHGMSAALNQAHQDQSTGGRVFWMQKLLLTKMDGNDLLSHIKTMAKYHECLDSLISCKNPLTADNVHVAALISSIPQDWLHCVSALMNQDGVKSKIVVTALKNEYTRLQSQSDVAASVSSAKSRQSQSSKQSTKHCYFCKVDGHDLNNCYNTCCILK